MMEGLSGMFGGDTEGEDAEVGVAREQAPGSEVGLGGARRQELHVACQGPGI